MPTAPLVFTPLFGVKRNVGRISGSARAVSYGAARPNTGQHPPARTRFLAIIMAIRSALFRRQATIADAAAGILPLSLPDLPSLRVRNSVEKPCLKRTAWHPATLKSAAFFAGCPTSRFSAPLVFTHADALISYVSSSALQRCCKLFTSWRMISARSPSCSHAARTVWA